MQRWFKASSGLGQHGACGPCTNEKAAGTGLVILDRRWPCGNENDRRDKRAAQRPQAIVVHESNIGHTSTCGARKSWSCIRTNAALSRVIRSAHQRTTILRRPAQQIGGLAMYAVADMEIGGTYRTTMRVDVLGQRSGLSLPCYERSARAVMDAMGSIGKESAPSGEVRKLVDYIA